MYVQTCAFILCTFNASVTPINNLQKEDSRVRRAIVCFYLQTSKSQGLNKFRQNGDVPVNSNLGALSSSLMSGCYNESGSRSRQDPGPSFEAPSEGFLQAGGMTRLFLALNKHLSKPGASPVCWRLVAGRAAQRLCSSPEDGPWSCAGDPELPHSSHEPVLSTCGQVPAWPVLWAQECCAQPAAACSSVPHGKQCSGTPDGTMQEWRGTC